MLPPPEPTRNEYFQSFVNFSPNFREIFVKILTNFQNSQNILLNFQKIINFSLIFKNFLKIFESEKTLNFWFIQCKIALPIAPGIPHPQILYKLLKRIFEKRLFVNIFCSLKFSYKNGILGQEKWWNFWNKDSIFSTLIRFKIFNFVIIWPRTLSGRIAPPEKSRRNPGDASVWLNEVQIRMLANFIKY